MNSSSNFTGPMVSARAAALCVELETLMRPLGYHVGLTGSQLYGMGSKPAKDFDVILYPHSKDSMPPEKLQPHLEKIGFHFTMGIPEHYKRYVVITYRDNEFGTHDRVDFFFFNDNSH